MEFPTLAIVDLETTGADARTERITEIAILRVEGGVLRERWSSLVNPERQIPERIQNLIGITDEMVVDAPTFADLAEAVRARLTDAVVVAHNVRFDYGFLRAEFEALGQWFEAPTLCSVKLSRALFPQFARHGLDALIERHGYAISARHRALDDAEVVWQFLQDRQRDIPANTLAQAWQRGFNARGAVRLPRGDLEALEDVPGVFLLRHADGHAIEIGRTRNLRSDLLARFVRPDKKGEKQRRQLAAVQSVEHVVVAGELEAALVELQWRQREGERQEAAWAWLWSADVPKLQLKVLAAEDPQAWGAVYALCRGEAEAKKLLHTLVRKYQLCPQRVGLERGRGACSALGLRACKGVCAERETPTQHDERLLAALTPLQLKAWSSNGPLCVTEQHGARAVWHVFDQWCYLGTVTQQSEVASLFAQPRRFDAAIWRLLMRWFARADHPE